MRLRFLATIFLATVLLPAIALGQETPGTVRFPAELDTQSSLFQVADSPQTRLSVSLNSSGTTATVVSGGTSGFPAAGSIKIDNEVLYYTSKTSGQFLGLTRGAAGTSAASHGSGSAVRSPILAVHHNTLAAGITATQAKIGKGASSAAAASTGWCIKKNGDGTTTWQACAGGGGLADPGGSNDDILQRKAGAWTFRTLAQYRADLAFAFSDITGAATDAQVPNNITVDLATIATTANAGDSATSFFPSGTVEAARLPDLSGLNGSVTDAQVPNSITVDLATTATTANAGDSATSFFPSGTIEAARLGSGTANSSTFLRGDGTWAAPAGSGDMLLGTAQSVTAAKTFSDGALILNGGDYGAADGSLPTGVEKAFFLNTNASSRRLFLYNAGSYRAIFQAGIDLVNLGSNVTGALSGSNMAAATDTAQGATELATAAETTTGTDATRAITPDGLAGSAFGTRTASLVVFDWAVDTATGDGKFYFVVPEELNGMNLIGVSAQVVNAGTTSTLNVDLARCAVVAMGNMCSGTASDVLSTNLTIDSGENKSSTAATPAVIDTSNDDVATDQVIRVDVDAVHTTAAKGLIVTLRFRLP